MDRTLFILLGLVECMRRGLLQQMNDPMCQSVSLLCGCALQKRWNGSRFCLGLWLLEALTELSMGWVDPRTTLGPSNIYCIRCWWSCYGKGQLEKTSPIVSYNKRFIRQLAPHSMRPSLNYFKRFLFCTYIWVSYHLNLFISKSSRSSLVIWYFQCPNLPQFSLVIIVLGCIECIRCSLMLPMIAVFVSLSVRLSHGSTRLYCAKTAERIKMLLGVNTHYRGSMEHCVRRRFWSPTERGHVTTSEFWDPLVSPERLKLHI